jgi:hypothetical protein
MTTFSQAIYRYLKNDDGTEETVRLWQAEPGTAEEQAVAFAGQLHDDFEVLLRSAACSYSSDDDETQLLIDLAEIVLTHVNFGRIARTLMRDAEVYRFVPPSLTPSAN